MTITTKIKVIPVFLLILILFLGINLTCVEAKSDLVVEGSVLGYNLYSIKPFGFDGLTYPALIKVEKVNEGKENSEFILVLFSNLSKDYAEEKFGVNKILSFSLKRQKFCDKKIKSLLYPGLTVKNEKVVETSQTFTFVPGVKKTSLPLKKVIPCYLFSQEN